MLTDKDIREIAERNRVLGSHTVSRLLEHIRWLTNEMETAKYNEKNRDCTGCGIVGAVREENERLKARVAELEKLIFDTFYNAPNKCINQSVNQCKNDLWCYVLCNEEMKLRKPDGGAAE